jgi:hypothetical protein
MRAIDKAWAGGFYDGEGCMTGSKKKGNCEVPSLRINQSGPSLDHPPEVLIRFHRVIGGRGIMYGPEVLPNRQPRWTLIVGRWQEVQDAAEILWPYIGTVKRDQINRRFAEYMEDIARREPLHRRNRTHCPQNHDYTPENTYVSTSGSRHCVECNRTKSREYQRRVRAQRRLRAA